MATALKIYEKKELLEELAHHIDTGLGKLSITYKKQSDIAKARHYKEDEVRKFLRSHAFDNNEARLRKAAYQLEEKIKYKFYEIAKGETKKKNKSESDSYAPKRKMMGEVTNLSDTPVGKITTQTTEKANKKPTITRGGFTNRSANVEVGQSLKQPPKPPVAPIVLTAKQQAAQREQILAAAARRKAQEEANKKLSSQGRTPKRSRKGPPISRGGNTTRARGSRPPGRNAGRTKMRPPTKPGLVKLQQKGPNPATAGIPQQNNPNLKIKPKLGIAPFKPSPGAASLSILSQIDTYEPTHSVSVTTSTGRGRGSDAGDRRRDMEIADTDTSDGKRTEQEGGMGPRQQQGAGGGNGSPPRKGNKKRRKDSLPKELRALERDAKMALKIAQVALRIPWPVWVVAAVILLIIIIIAVFAGGFTSQPPPPPPTLCQDPGAPAAGEPSTEEFMNRYGHNPAEVEANLVDINFQGKTVKVHKLVQPVFDKVNTEITQANTGYAIRQVGTYAWREKNGGGSGLSTHSFGTTIDINPDTNPYTEGPTHDIPPVIADIFKRNGFSWGGDWQGKHDWMHFQYNALPPPGPGAPAPGGGAPGCGGATNENWVAPAPADSCGGKYAADAAKNTLLHMNFGDPQCNFDKDKLRQLLVKQENNNEAFVNYWFVVIIPGESGFNPNAWAEPVGLQGELDTLGAWGLYQKGGSRPPGSPPPAAGKNGPLDRGDVNWEVQTANAVKANHEAGCDFWYYGTFRKSAEGSAGQMKRC